MRNSFRPTRDYMHFIDGSWIRGQSYFEAIDPSVGKAWAEIPQGTVEDVQHAVTAATHAHQTWSRSSGEERQRLLLAIADRFEQHGKGFASLLATENGRPVREAHMADIPTVTAIYRYFAGTVRAHHGDHIPVNDPLSLVYTTREPLGVIGVLLPWNSPLITLANKLAPLLATGNTAIIKPSEFASASVLEFVRLVEDLLPPGAVNVVCGFGTDVGAAISSHPDIAKLTFTGGPETARTVLASAATALTPTLMELGGKGAMIVAEDASLDKAVEDALLGIYTANGEACIASSRLILHDRIYDEFVERFTKKVENIRIGDATNLDTEFGPLVSRAQQQRVHGHLEKAKEEGLDFLTSAKAPAGELSEGYFQPPVLLADNKGISTISKTEVFGPVAVAQRFTSYEDAVQRANSTRYGLACGIWTRDLARAHRIANDLKAGIVWVNKWFDLAVGMPMGGVKDSGFGRETGEITLDEYSTTKSINIDLDAPRPQLWGTG